LEALAESFHAQGVALIRPADREAPLEAMANLVDLNAAALFVGIRSLDSDARCVAVHVPPDPPKPSAGTVGDQPRDLKRAVRYADAVERAKLSSEVAAHVASLVPTCPVPPDEWVEYFLTASRGPTIVVEFRSADDGQRRGAEGPVLDNLLHGVSEAIGRFFAEAPHNKWMHQTKRFD